MKTDRFERRRFLLGAGALALAPRAGAQQGPRSVGLLSQNSMKSVRAWFVRALAKRGWREGEHFRFEHVVTGSDPARWDVVARDLVGRRPDLIVALGSHMAVLAKRATTTIPIVMMLSGDPIAAGIVEHYARPGGNVTGLRTYVDGIWGKYLELMRELVPGLRRLGLLSDYEPPMFVEREVNSGFDEMGRMARTLGIDMHRWRVRDDEGFHRALGDIARVAPDVLFVTSGPVHGQPRNMERLRALVAQRRLPMVNDLPGFVFRNAGGVMSYAVGWDEITARTASFVDRILKGAAPGALPIEQPTELELVVSLKAARAIGLEVSQRLLLRATRVIE